MTDRALGIGAVLVVAVHDGERGHFIALLELLDVLADLLDVTRDIVTFDRTTPFDVFWYLPVLYAHGLGQPVLL